MCRTVIQYCFDKSGDRITKRGKWLLGKSLIMHINEIYLDNPLSNDGSILNINNADPDTLQNIS